ncbi:MAG TPA: hypothetical protein VIL20_12540 [Sandaracinaceae bacterium]
MRPFAIAIVLLAAGCDAPPLDRSCAGESVGLCAPFEYAVVTSASMEPNELPVADFSRTAHIRVEFARCESAPAPHVIDLLAIVPDEDPPDAGGTGDPVRVTNLLTLRDGADGDVQAGDGVIDVEVANPLLNTIPTESDITLRFTPRSTAPAGCTGGSFDVPYRTGPARTM